MTTPDLVALRALVEAAVLRRNTQLRPPEEFTTPYDWIVIPRIDFDAVRANLPAAREALERMEGIAKDRDRLQAWVHDLQAGMYINCVYCGHRYGPDDEVPATMAQALKEHIEQCPKHPMSALKARLAELEAASAQSPRDVMFPIQSERGHSAHPTRIPWSVADKAYSVYRARSGDDQSLERLAERGGFAPGEMDLFYPAWEQEASGVAVLKARLARLEEALIAASYVVARFTAIGIRDEATGMTGEQLMAKIDAALEGRDA